MPPISYAFGLYALLVMKHNTSILTKSNFHPHIKAMGHLKYKKADIYKKNNKITEILHERVLKFWLEDSTYNLILFFWSLKSFWNNDYDPYTYAKWMYTKIKKKSSIRYNCIKEKKNIFGIIFLNNDVLKITIFLKRNSFNSPITLLLKSNNNTIKMWW